MKTENEKNDLFLHTQHYISGVDETFILLRAHFKRHETLLGTNTRETQVFNKLFVLSCAPR
jgi:hypothetical protein